MADFVTVTSNNTLTVSVEDAGTSNLYVSSKLLLQDQQATKVTQSGFQALVTANSLEVGKLYYVTDSNQIYVPKTTNTYNVITGMHVGSSAPSDTSLIWIDTSI